MWPFRRPKPAERRFDRLASGRSIPRGDTNRDEVIGRRGITRQEGSKGNHSGRGRHGRRAGK